MPKIIVQTKAATVKALIKASIKANKEKKERGGESTPYNTFSRWG